VYRDVVKHKQALNTTIELVATDPGMSYLGV
jgi:hypothetical protein